MAKTKGAVSLTKSERDVIRLKLARGETPDEIAAFTGRSRAGIYRAIQRMKADGSLGQLVLDLGQGGEK